MKVNRSILILSFFVGIVSLFFVIFLSKDTKEFQIALAFIGSSFISFLLELPNFISMKVNNLNMVYYTLQDIKASTSILIMSINDLLNNDIVIDKFYEQQIQKIETNVNNLKLFDHNYYLLRRNNTIMLNSINSIYGAFSNIKTSSLKYSVNYSTLGLSNARKGQSRNIFSNEMANELMCIRENSEYLINLMNTQVKHIFTKTTYRRWLNDDAFLNNTNNSIKITQK